MKCQCCAGIGWKKVYRFHDSSSGTDLDPLPFHICNVAMHAIVTCALYVLALRLCTVRDSLMPSATIGGGTGLHRHGDMLEVHGGSKRMHGNVKKKGSGVEGGLRQRRSTIPTDAFDLESTSQRSRKGMHFVP
jgi:hypothetical protein